MLRTSLYRIKKENSDFFYVSYDSKWKLSFLNPHLERVQPVKVLVHDGGEPVPAEVQDPEPREAPQGPGAHVGHLRVRDDQDLEQAEVLEVGADGQDVVPPLQAPSGGEGAVPR